MIRLDDAGALVAEILTESVWGALTQRLFVHPK
jgi:hypothetical protein